MRKHLVGLLIASLTCTVSGVIAFKYREYQWQQQWIASKEDSLYGKLFYMRRCIDSYAAENGELPQSLDDLVKAECLREIPRDPMTQMHTWKIVAGDNPNSLK